MALALRSGHLLDCISLSLSHTLASPFLLIIYAYFMILFRLFSASVLEDSFEYLDAAVERIAGADVPMPYAANLERMAVPQVCPSIVFLAFE